MERLTSRQTIRHTDGTAQIETYCHGHRYGPAAFPKKYGTSDPQEYKDYCEMVDRIADYEDTGLEPEEVTGLCAMDKRAKMADLLRLEEYQAIGTPDEFRAALRRTAEDDKAREEGRLVVLPCKVGDDVFTMRWSIKNEKYEVFAGNVKNVRYDAIDGSVMVSDGEYYREWGKDAFSSRQAAEAALGGGEGAN